MRKKWIIIGLAAGLLAAVLAGGVALAWGGGGKGWGRGHDSGRLSDLAGKVAGILGTDEQETADAIAQAQRELREEANDAALADIASRVAGTLGTDVESTTGAMEQVAGEMQGEALEAKLQQAIDNGRITEDEAQEYRNNWEEGGWAGKGFLFRGIDTQAYADRVGAMLEVDGEAVSGDDVAAAIEQAKEDIQSEALEARLQAAIESGGITEEEAEEIREKIASGDWKGLRKTGTARKARGQRPLVEGPSREPSRRLGPTGPLTQAP